MSNHDGSHPEYFEELCALAASGQISEPEFVELQDHMQHCAPCRSAYSDFVDLLHNKMPLVDPEMTGSFKLPGFFSEDSSCRERFFARARKQGLDVSGGSLRDTSWRKLGTWLWPRMHYTQAVSLAMALLLFTAGILGYNLRQSNGRYRTLAADIAEMSKRLSQEGNPGRIQPMENHPPETAPPPPALASGFVTKGELVKARQEFAAAEALAKFLEERLQATASELQTLRAQHEEAADSRNQLERKLTEAELALTRVNDELQRVRQGHSEDGATIAAQGREIRGLSEKLGAQTEMLERERTLLAAGRDIHDLMGARNLHIVDVLDVDSKGKDRRAFGRVFYTEGKSLIFYAFDLADRNTAKRNASFQVWGDRGPARSPAQSLGILYVDDQKQNRWVLKFEDPHTLAEIDSVFVTVEPPGGSSRPTGRKFLYAYLKANPNHP